jgi:hypothetical protein
MFLYPLTFFCIGARNRPTGKTRRNGWLNLIPIDYEKNIIQKSDNNCSADIGFYFADILSRGNSRLFQIIFTLSDSYRKPDVVQDDLHR